jgi:hypothetical protein
MHLNFRLIRNFPSEQVISKVNFFPASYLLVFQNKPPAPVGIGLGILGSTLAISLIASVFFFVVRPQL